MTKKSDKQILFERMNKVTGMPLNENFDSNTERAIMDIIQELQSDSDYSLSSNPKDIQWVVQNIMDAFQKENLDAKKVQDYVVKYFQGEEEGMVKAQRGPEAPQNPSPELQKFLYIDRFLGDKMTEEQAIKILDDAKQELGIGDMETFKTNVTAGALYALLSEYEGEMGGFNRY